MRCFTLFLMALMAYGQGGTPLAGPVRVLPAADNSYQNPLNWMDTTGRYVGLIAPTAVTDIVVSAATAASPMVLTLATDAPPTVVVGGTVTLSGALGAGCSGMNATHPVSAVSGTSVTITFNGAGCTYTINSAALKTYFYWELPGVDGTSGTCIGWTSAYVLGWNACTAGGSTPPFSDANPIMKNSVDATKLLSYDLSGFTTATTRTLTPQNASYVIAGTNISNMFSADQIMGADLLADSDGVRKIGTTNRFYSVAANRIDGACPTVVFSCTSSNNYVTTRKLNLADSVGTTDTAMDIFATVSSGNSYMQIRDNAGDDMLRLTRDFMGSTQNIAALDLNFHPWTNEQWTIGSPSFRWLYLYTKDARVSSLGGSGTRCVQVDNDGDLAVAGAGCSSSGANTFLSNLTGPTAINASLQFDTDNTYNIGESPTATTRIAPNTVYASTTMETPKLRLSWPGSGATTNYFDLIGNNNFFTIANSSGDSLLQYNATGGLASAFWDIRGHIIPRDNNSYDLGSPNTGPFGAPEAWRKVYAYDQRIINLAGVGTRCVQVNVSGDLAAASGACGTSGVSSVTASSPLFSSGGATPNITCQTATNVTAGCLTSTDWNTFNGKMTNPMTTSGDMVYGGISGTPTRLALGSGALQVSGGAPAWSNTLGTAANPFTAAYTSSLRVVRGASQYWDITAGIQSLVIKDEFGTTSATLNTAAFLRGLQVFGGVRSTAANTYDLGASGIEWRSLYLSTSIEGTFNLGGNMTVTGNFYNRYVGGSAGISCAAVGNGWTGITSDNYVVVCTNSGTRTRAALTAY
jgi:hypothetical protein